MPTAAKLIAGLALAITSAIAAYVFIGEHPEMPLGARFIGGNAVVGFFAGWYSLGKNPGHGNIAGGANGLRTLVLLLIGAGLVFSGVFVLGNLERLNFRDPMDMPLLWIQTAFEYVVLAMSQNVLIVLGVGGVLSGIASYQASIRWR